MTPKNDETDALAVADKAAAKGRRYTKTGLYSWVKSKRLPGGRGFQATRKELAMTREELIRERGGPDKVTAGELILIDSVVEALGVQKILGLYVRKYGVMDGRAAKRGIMELSPVLSRNWISYGNTVRQGLLALEELRKARPKEDGLGALQAHLASMDASGAAVYEVPEDAPAAGESGPGSPQDGRSDADPGQGAGDKGE